jgi:hypothetical protein
MMTKMLSVAPSATAFLGKEGGFELSEKKKKHQKTATVPTAPNKKPLPPIFPADSFQPRSVVGRAGQLPRAVEREMEHLGDVFIPTTVKPVLQEWATTVTDLADSKLTAVLQHSRTTGSQQDYSVFSNIQAGVVKYLRHIASGFDTLEQGYTAVGKQLLTGSTTHPGSLVALGELLEPGFSERLAGEKGAETPLASATAKLVLALSA